MPAAPRGLKKVSGIPELKLPRRESHRVPGVRNLLGSLGEQQMRLASEPSPQLQPYCFDPNNIYFNLHICVCCNAAPILTFGFQTVSWVIVSSFPIHCGVSFLDGRPTRGEP